jgi:hypothetical protein
VWLAVLWSVAILVWRRRRNLLTVRGFGVRADVGRLHDVPRVVVGELTMISPEVARIALQPSSPQEQDNPRNRAVEGTFLIGLNERDPGFEILQGWLEDQSILGAVMPPESRIIRLRSLDDLQPLTLRRIDD